MKKKDYPERLEKGVIDVKNQIKINRLFLMGRYD